MDGQLINTNTYFTRKDIFPPTRLLKDSLASPNIRKIRIIFSRILFFETAITHISHNPSRWINIQNRTVTSVRLSLVDLTTPYFLLSIYESMANNSGKGQCIRFEWSLIRIEWRFKWNWNSTRCF